MVFKQISIIGMGLIGSSLARAINKHGLAEKLVAIDCNSDVCKKVLELDIADEATISVGKGVENADLVIIAAPVGAFKDIGRRIAGYLKEGCIVSDVGSVKQEVIKSLSPFIPAGVHFIPAHPIAGTEHSGPEAGFAELFERRWCILTPADDADVRVVEKLVALWEGCGAMIAYMSPGQHDRAFAMISHLPHLIAFSIVRTTCNLEDDMAAEIMKYSAGGFRDYTRIAGSDPTMWRDIFMQNKEAVLDIVSRFKDDLGRLEQAIQDGDTDLLFNEFTHSRKIRKEVIEEGMQLHSKDENR